eukprot:4163922-Amphidinium_carterae.1
MAVERICTALHCKKGSVRWGPSRSLNAYTLTEIDMLSGTRKPHFASAAMMHTCGCVQSEQK